MLVSFIVNGTFLQECRRETYWTNICIPVGNKQHERPRHAVRGLYGNDAGVTEWL